jgi:hypothetical protein
VTRERTVMGHHHRVKPRATWERLELQGDPWWVGWALKHSQNCSFMLLG